MRTATGNGGHIKQVYKAIRLFHPHILEEIKPKLVEPKPVFLHTILLPTLLKRFCELKEVPEKLLIGVRHGSDSVKLKKLFIAVIVRLYDPRLLTGIHTETLRNNLRIELSGLLKADCTWISQVTNDIIVQLNPHKPKPAYEDFRNEVNKIAKALEIEFAK